MTDLKFVESEENLLITAQKLGAVNICVHSTCVC